jgi:hypothetical protein
LELSVAEGATRYHKIAHDPQAIEGLFVDLFIEAHRRAPRQIILDLDATDDPLHGTQEGRFFHGYYDGYCYLPLYIFCGRHLLVAKLRRSDIDASAGALEEVERVVTQIRARWPKVRIVLRADSGFAREPLMKWCESEGDGRAHRSASSSVPGLSLRDAQELEPAAARDRQAEYLADKANPRFLVTSLGAEEWPAQRLYEQLYCARGEMENRIKAQLELFADRTSSHTFKANQLRLWLSSFAYVLIEALRRLGLRNTALVSTTAGSIRLKLIKIGALIRVSVRRVKVAMSSAHPYQAEFIAAFKALGTAGRA